MAAFRAFCDDFFAATRLYTKLELGPTRESLLHFFERIRREFPAMTRMRRRDEDALVLEEDEVNDSKRFLRVDNDALRFGCHNPEDTSLLGDMGRCILTQAPAHLGLSDLDIDHMEVVFGFDLEFAGNHDELVAETLFADHPLFSQHAMEGQRVIDCQPFWGFTLTPECDSQAYIEIKSRTTTFEVRTGEYEPSILTVFATVRRYWGFRPAPDLADVQRELLALCEQFADGRVVPFVVQPLAQAIASRRGSQ